MKSLLIMVLAVMVVCLGGVPAHAGVNDFTITNYDIKLSLGQDNDNRSTLMTVETITAKFPSSDQNHGLERAIPQSYDGHPTSLKIESVEKADGSKWNYSTHTSNDNLVLRIGDSDKYVHGEQTYVITYIQRDVTRYFENTGRDEFYWDTNGTQWNVPIQKLTVQLRIEPSLATAQTGNTGCYQGVSGANGTCELVKNDETFRVDAQNLRTGENVTVAIGFKQGTFAGYERSVWDWIVYGYLISLFVVGTLGIGLIVWLIYRWSRQSNRKSELGTIVPEYVAPRDASITTAASLVAGSSAAFTAQLLDFAVRHYIKIYQVSDKSLFKQAEYEIEIVRDISDLKEEEQEIFRDIFGEPAVGTRLALKSLKNNTSVYNKTLDNDTKLKALVRGEYGLRQKDQPKSAAFKKIGWVTLVLSFVILNPLLLIAAIVAFVCAHTLWPLTDKGLALYRYLEGLKMYIKVAETERLNMLQSPEGAAKVGGVRADDKAQLIKLYENVLPYAVLFGQEKEWNKRIGAMYESLGKNPDWYSGNNAVFNAAVFSSAMNNFSTQATYSSASSSTSGGSSGGGSSGGGGGGGGGGGW